MVIFVVGPFLFGGRGKQVVAAAAALVVFSAAAAAPGDRIGKGLQRGETPLEQLKRVHSRQPNTNFVRACERLKRGFFFFPTCASEKVDIPLSFSPEGLARRYRRN